jgi:hypothetical protein
VPVDLHGARDVTRLVEEHILVGLDDDQARLAEMRCEPVGGDESSRLCVLCELLG